MGQHQSQSQSSSANQASQSQSQHQGGQSQRQNSGSSNAEGLWGDDAPRAAPVVCAVETRAAPADVSPAGFSQYDRGPGNPDAQRMEAEPRGPLAGNQPQAIDNPVGTPTPVYDQYEVNQPQNMHQPAAVDDVDRRRRQASAQEGVMDGFGYGADGEEPMADAPGSGDAEHDEPLASGAGDTPGSTRSKAEYDER